MDLDAGTSKASDRAEAVRSAILSSLVSWSSSSWWCAVLLLLLVVVAVVVVVVVVVEVIVGLARPPTRTTLTYASCTARTQSDHLVNGYLPHLASDGSLGKPMAAVSTEARPYVLFSPFQIISGCQG